jgi:hypothetical protein
LRDEYVARLGPRDHFNSRGERLISAAAIIRQDRANYHEFGIRDAEDESDHFFAAKQNRALMERYLERGRATQAAISAIVNDTPLVVVQLCGGPRGDYITVTVK